MGFNLLKSYSKSWLGMQSINSSISFQDLGPRKTAAAAEECSHKIYCSWLWRERTLKKSGYKFLWPSSVLFKNKRPFLNRPFFSVFWEYLYIRRPRKNQKAEKCDPHNLLSTVCVCGDFILLIFFYASVNLNLHAYLIRARRIVCWIQLLAFIIFSSLIILSEGK